jgi:calcineurin-like phosphoesterase family protein
MIYFTSDLHFSHDNIIKYCNRPFVDSNQMNEALISNWNAIVKDDDLVYVLGDDCMCHPKDVEHLFKRLKGKKIKIYGNHDKKKYANWYRRLGYIDCYDELIMTIANERVMLNHFPYRPTLWRSIVSWCKCNADLKYRDKRPLNKGGFLLSGHTHQTDRVRGRNICVCVEAWDYRPVSIREIEQIIQDVKRSEG